MKIVAVGDLVDASYLITGYLMIDATYAMDADPGLMPNHPPCLPNPFSRRYNSSRVGLTETCPV